MVFCFYVSFTFLFAEERGEVWILCMWDYMQVFNRNGLGLVLMPGSMAPGSESECELYVRIGLADTLDLQHFDACKLQRI